MHQIITINYISIISEIYKEITIQVYPIEGLPGVLQSFVASNIDTQGIQTFPYMAIFIVETKVDYVFYFKTFDEGALKVYVELPKNISSEKEIDLYEKGIILEMKL
jgi:hypothetical protein